VVDEPGAETPKKKYRPWGHMQWAPQWLRMFILGESKPFHKPRERDLWRSKSETLRNIFREEWPGEIKERDSTIARMQSLAQISLTAEGFLFGGLLGFAAAQKFTGPTADLMMTCVYLIVPSLIFLVRASMPPPHTLFTTFEDPYEYHTPKPEEAEKEATPDEGKMLKLRERLLKKNALTQATKRYVGWAGVLLIAGLVVFLVFLKKVTG
jgi:hypothetical protein